MFTLTRPRCRLTPVVMLALAVARSAVADDGVKLVHDFDSPPQDHFVFIRGQAGVPRSEVEWRKGALELPPAGKLLCTQLVGKLADVRVVVLLPASREKQYGCTLSYQDLEEVKSGQGVINLGLTRTETGTKLAFGPPLGNLMLADLPPAAGNGGDQAWHLRLQVRHGLARGKAWLVGTPSRRPGR